MRLYLALTFLLGAHENIAEAAARQVRPNESWDFNNGRFYRNGQWVFLKSGKLLHSFDDAGKTNQIIGEIDALIDSLNYNNLSLNIYPDSFDADADGRVDPSKQAAYSGVARIIDHCWERGIFCSLSFETYNVGGGGTPQSLFTSHPETRAINALNQPASDIEYGTLKPIPSIYHPLYLEWSRNFIKYFLAGISKDRLSRLLYVETTVEPQYLGFDNYNNPPDDRRAALDYGQSAQQAFVQWNAALPSNDPRKNAFTWPTTQAQRDASIGNQVFNDFRAEQLGGWVSGDIAAIRAVAPEVYAAVDYNGRFDDAPKYRRVGNHLPCLAAINGANIIQVAPNAPVWGTSSWDEVIQINQQKSKNWAISEHMTVAGAFSEDDGEITDILQNTLQRGTRFGWDFVNPRNTRATDFFSLYFSNWTGPVLDVIEYANWNGWVQQIGAPAFTPQPREPIALTQVAVDLGTFDIEYCMTHPQTNNGNTTPVTIGGRDCRRNTTVALDRYFYFSVKDDFAYQGNKPSVDITMQYYDTGTGMLSLEYDAADGNVYKNGGSIALTGTQIWKQHTYTITGAYFGNRQVAGADFRIAGDIGNVFYLDVVSVVAQQLAPPDIAEVVPDPQVIFPNSPYSQQLTLLEGSPLPTWTVIQGPAGLQVNAAGLVTGWTPSAFGYYLMEIEATNSQGSDTESWMVRVVSRFDYDVDNDVDLSDFGHLQRCLSGDGVSYGPGCANADANGDGDVDSSDFNSFLTCMMGPGNIPGC